MNKLVMSMGVVCATAFATSALADKPAANVNCDSLASAISSADAFLDANNVEFKSLGELVSVAVLDPTTNATLVAVINAFYSGPDFVSSEQFLSSTAKCGLTPHLIAEIND